ncbi:hypothetical protein [Priestia koreensis]|uniref:hypothetical protein n=1 Tax=Priestia koreensis TaxID=284581 RepID=UPI0030181491
MYRTSINDQEIIVLFSSPNVSLSPDTTKHVYERVLSLGEKLFQFQDGQSFTIGDPKGLIVAQVKKRDLTTVYVEHVITKQFMYNEQGESNQIM